MKLDELLATRSFGRAHEHHASIASTNDRALAWAREGAPHGALVTADAQTAGRGRRGREWSSPAQGDIYASVILRPEATQHLGALGLAVGLGLRDGLPEVPGGIGLKWPNDLVVEGRKLAGILCETRWQNQTPDVVVGFGINVHRRVFEEPLAAIATSLALLVPSLEQGRSRILADVLAGLEAVLEPFVVDGFEHIRARYEAHSVVIGKTVELRRDGEDPRTVHVEGIDPDGALRVRARASAPTERVESADVSVVA